MNPQAAKAGLTLALFVAMASALILPLQPAGSAEFVVTTFALVVGLLGAGVIALAIRRFSH